MAAPSGACVVRIEHAGDRYAVAGIGKASPGSCRRLSYTAQGSSWSPPSWSPEHCEMATRVACEAVLAVVEVPGPSRSSWTQLTSPAAPPESGPPKPERPLLLIWFLATFRTVTPQ
jgi:hypothetical protein